MSLVFPEAEITGHIGGTGLSSRKPVRIATIVNGTLATAFADGQTIDNVLLNTGDRILIKNQTNLLQNGVYVVPAAGEPVRATDYDDGDAVASSFVYIQEGSVNGGSGWLCTNLAGSDIVGTNDISFKLISGDVSGAPSTDNAIVRWDGTLGTKIQNSAVVIDDSNNMSGLRYLQFSDITAPSNPAAGQGRLYKKTGDDGIWWKPDAAGPEVDLTAAGGGGVDTFQTSLAGLTPSVATTGAVTLAGTLGAGSGGTGTTSAPTSGQLLVGTSGGAYTPYTVTSGTGISTTVGSGTFQINNTGVQSISAGTTGLTPSVATTGAVTIAGTLVAVNGGTGINSYAVGDLLFADTTTTLAKLADVATGNALISGGIGVAPSWSKIGLTTHVSGVLAVGSGGTNSSTALNNNRVMVSSGGAIVESAALTNGQLVIGSTGDAPVVAALTAGGGISVTNGAGSITVANTGVLSLSAGTTGLTPSVATTGAVTLAGTLNIASGGTNLSTVPTNGQLLIGNGTGYTLSALTAGGGISVTNGVGSVTLANTGVLSLAGTTNQITASASTGAITLSTPGQFIAPGTIRDTTGMLYSSTTVTAAGTTQGTATALLTSYNVVGTVAAGTGVALQSATAGYIVTVINKGANSLNVYPAIGDVIDAAGTNIPIVLLVGGSITLQAIDASQWYTVVPPVTATAGTSVSYSNGRTVLSSLVSPMTTKGDLWTYSTVNARLPVGTNNYLLTADSAETTGLRWTQSLQPAQLPFGVISDTISADTNNYNPAGLSTAVQIRLTPSGASWSITGLVISGSAGAPNNNELKITNVGTQFNIILRSESASSTAANRFVFDGQDVVIMPGQNCTIWYDWTAARWRGVAFSADGRFGGQYVTAGVVTPATIAASQDNYAPTGLENAAVLRLASSAIVSITGLGGGFDGRRLSIVNIGTLPITLVNQSLSSLAANRFYTGTSDTTIVGNNVASLIYDGTNGFWRITGGTGGATTGAGGLVQSQWIEVFTDRITTATTWTTYYSRINAAATLPTGTITVVTTVAAAPTPTTPGSPAALAASPTNPQTLIIQSTTNDVQIVTYQGSTGTTFTGCSGGIGAIAVNNIVFNGPLQTSITAGSNGVSLPTGTINVVSTTGFPTSGILLVTTANGTQRVLYTNTTATTFINCSLGTGTMSTGGRVFNVSATANDLLTINTSTSGGALIIISTTNASTDSNRTGYLHVVVDGFVRRGGSTQGNGGAPSGSSVVSLKLSNVPAGDHVVTTRWVVEGGNFVVAPVTRSQDNNASLLVQEVSS